MKKTLVILSIIIFTLTTYADCQEKVSIINSTGDPSKAGVPLQIYIQKGGNVKWNPDLTGTVLNVFQTASSTMTYASTPPVNTNVLIYDNNQGVIERNFQSKFDNACHIHWDWGCTSPYHPTVKKDNSGAWIITIFNN